MPKLNRSFATPFWIMLTVLIIRSSLSVWTLIVIGQAPAMHGNTQFKIALVANLFIILVLLAEAIIYWRIRRRIYNKGWVLAHLLLTILAMIIAPLVLFVVPWIADRFVSGASTMEIIAKLRYVNICLFLGGMILGSVFFGAIIIKARRFKSALQEADIEGDGISIFED